MSRVIAILCSDIHFSDLKPRARAAEDSWYEAMERTMWPLREEQMTHHCSVLIAGDIFHRWNPSPRLINFAIDALPQMSYAIPGQHDLPHHSLERIDRSAFWTLVHAGAVAYLKHGAPHDIPGADNWVMYGFPWGTEPWELPENPDAKRIAVVHEYCWTKGRSYPGAPEEGNYKRLAEKYKDFDVAVFGDNHIPFKMDCKPLIYNSGAFIRRNKPEAEYGASYGLLYEDGTVERKYFDDNANWADLADLPEEDALPDIRDFMASLQDGAYDEVDFIAAIHRAAEATENDQTKELLLEMIDGLE